MVKQSNWTSLIILICLLGLPGTLKAEEPEPGVGRVSLINGDVSTMRGDSGDWVASTVNAPVVQGDKIATGKQSRTEIQLDYANIMRLDQGTEARIAELSHGRIQVQLAQGQLSLTVLKDNEANVEVDTPNVAVRPIQEGVYRIQVLSDSQSLVIVRNGEAEISTGQGSARVGKNDMITIRGADNPEYKVSQAPGIDTWDDWNNERNRQIQDAQSWRYANNYYTGAQDLDRYGRWVQAPGYDWVWSPYADADWAPYRSGRWCWEPYWGWTWVSYEPWGWAPYHYGRWFWYNSGWCWWPGPVHAAYHPVWAPAYVSFFGFGYGGRNWSFGFGFGFNSIGWLPVGPCDRHYPWWGHNNNYNVVNVTSITNVRNVGGIGPLADPRQRPYYSNLQMALRDPRVQQGVTAVSTENFVQGRTDLHNQIRSGISLRNAQMVQGTVPAVPTRASLRPTDRVVNPASLPSRTASAQKFLGARQSTSAANSFSERVAQIQHMVQTRDALGVGNHAAGAAQGSQILPRTSTPAAGSSTRPTVATGQSVASPASSVSSQSVQRSASGQPGSWQRPSLTTSSRPQPTGITSPSLQGAFHGSGTSATSSAPNRSSWQRFSRETPADRGHVSVRESTPASGNSAPVQSDRYNRSFYSTQPGGARTLQSPTGSSSHWQRFSNGDRPTPSSPSNRSFGSFPSRSLSDRSAWDRISSPPDPRASMRYDTRPSYRPETSGSRSYESPRSYQRPPLQMNKPIVTERSTRSGSSGGQSVSRGGSRSAPSPSRSSGGGRR